MAPSDGPDLSRREFMLAGSTSLLALQGSVEPQLDTTQPTDEYQFRGVADLIGPAAAKPAPDDPFFEQKVAYAYRYEASDTGARFLITDDDTSWTRITMPLDDVSTPFDSLRTATQNSQFSIDASQGLTRRRYGWYSNNALFDSTLFTSNEANGSVDIATGSTANAARIRSAVAGQYASQAVAQPGAGLDIAPANVSVGSDDEVSLSHGTVAVGVGWHDGSAAGWGVGGPVQTFLGFVFQADGAYAVVVADGQHLGDSPVPQSEWNMDKLDGTGGSGEVLDPASGYIYNQPYTWYGHGALYTGIIDPESDETIMAHKFSVPTTSFDRPNLPTLVVVDDAGTAADLSVQLGGMQYTLYGPSGTGAGSNSGRATEIAATSVSANTQVAEANNAVDMQAEPGNPVISVQREAGARDTALDVTELLAKPDNPVWLFAWDEYEPAAALTNQNFREPNEPVDPTLESKIRVDTAATDYSPTTAVARGMDYIDTDKNESSLGQLTTNDRIPIDATRVISVVHDGTSAALDPVQLRVKEGY